MQEIARLKLACSPNMSWRMYTLPPPPTRLTASMSLRQDLDQLLGADHRFNLFLGTHHMFERRPESVGKAPVGHQY